MNDEQRAALVKQVQDFLDRAYMTGWECGSGDTMRGVVAGEAAANSIINLISSRLLADRAATVAEPDAEVGGLVVQQWSIDWTCPICKQKNHLGTDWEDEEFGDHCTHCESEAFFQREWGIPSVDARVFNQDGDEFPMTRAAIAAMPSGKDAATVERVQEAIEQYWRSHAEIEGGWSFAGMAEAATKAASRAAIAAMTPGKDADDEPWIGPRDKGVTVKATVVEADDVPMFPDLGTDADNWLDDALDSVHPETYVSYVLWESGSQGSWRACIRWPDSRMSARWGYPHLDSIGHGTTRREAILDAVQKAKGASGE